MGNRLSKIYTGTGDAGETGLAGNSRVSKASLRITAIGEIDETNSHLGLIRAHLADYSDDQINTLDDDLSHIQHWLFNAGGELSLPEAQLITDRHSTWLEQKIDQLNQHLPPLKEFALPAGSLLTAQTHICRSVCRRAERAIVALADHELIQQTLLTFFNRLSDYLFVLARTVARFDGGKEVMWDKDKSI